MKKLADLKRLLKETDWANFEILIPYSPFLVPALIGSLILLFKPGLRLSGFCLVALLSFIITAVVWSCKETRRQNGIPRNKLSILIRRQ